MGTSFNQRRDTVEDKAEQNTSALASAVVMATAMQIEEFEIKLNSYDEATVVALMENQELMDTVFVLETFLTARETLPPSGFCLGRRVNSGYSLKAHQYLI